MSKVFFDHLLPNTKLEKKIKSITSSVEEREELWTLVDEIIHHKVLDCVFDRLPENHHEDFVVKLHSSPHDEDLWNYLKDKIGHDIQLFVKAEIESVIDEILKDMKPSKSKK